MGLVSTLSGIPDWALVRAGEPAPWPQIEGDIASLIRAGRSAWQVPIAANPINPTCPGCSCRHSRPRHA